MPDLSGKNDSVKCRILDELIGEEDDPSVWTRYNDQMITIAEKNLKGLTGKPRIVYLRFLANGLNNTAFFLKEKGDVDSTLALFQKSLEIRYDIKDREGIANSLNNIGHVYYKLANFQLASNCYEKAIKVQEELKDSAGLGTSYNNLGSLYDAFNKPQEAIELFTKSLKIRQNLKDSAGQAYCINNLAKVYSDKGDDARALLLQLDAIHIREKMNARNELGTSYNNIGVMYLKNGDFGKSKEFLEKALKLNHEIEDLQSECVSYKNLGLLYQKQNQELKAIDCFSKSLAIAKGLGFPDDILWPAKGLYELHKKRGDYRIALEMCELYHQMQDSSHKEIKTVAPPVAPLLLENDTVKRPLQISEQITSDKVEGFRWATWLLLFWPLLMSC